MMKWLFLCLIVLVPLLLYAQSPSQVNCLQELGSVYLQARQLFVDKTELEKRVVALEAEIAALKKDKEK